MMATATIDNAATDRIMAILSKVPDPEIPAVSITDLGIVRSVRQNPPAVLITPTYTGCPATIAISAAVRKALDEAGFDNVAVETILSPPWTTDWISAEGRERLRAYGIAPPRTGPVECPRCGSRNTQEVSRFGSTPCKALWRCPDCSEPFDRFKCH
ncbi:MAG TPA: 1,2-phenylacetyl-CoA epoxidase subunit PaaD [Sphingobium sp.]|nr:1,2-phenylacetyl-CoA epoxidase subunit PaaD [Sphingobium sp.]